MRDEERPAPEEKKQFRAGSGAPDAQDGPPLFSGDALLRGLGENYALLATDAVSSPGLPEQSLATELVERILVARADQAGESREVRISLKESVLPDTEIILRRDGEKLIVSLLTDNASSHQVLLRAQRDLHEKLLALDAEATVEVLWRDGGQTGDDASSGRSRGLDYLQGEEPA
jgi:type III secretion system needle length determinant